MGWTLTGWGEAQVVGKVNLPSGANPGAVYVKVENLNTTILNSVYTDVQGRFYMDGIPRSDPNLFLIVEQEGYKPIRQQLDIVQRQGVLINIFLEPEAGPDARIGDGLLPVDLGQLLANIPEEAREEYEKALEESEDGDHSDAIRRLEKALELAPDFYDARIKLGLEYVELGQYRNAEQAYEQARRTSPNGALAPLNLGVLYYQEGEGQRAAEEIPEAAQSYEKARDSLEESVELSPLSATAQFYLGAALYRLQSYGEAEERLQRALEIEAGHGQARLMLLNVYARQTRYEAALEQAVAFLEENPDSPQYPAIQRVRSQLETALGC